MDKRFAHLNLANPKDGWVILGPGGGGCVHTLTINPLRPQMMVVSCDMTAGYITYNGGESWREFNLKSRQYAYAFHPQDANTLYVGSSGLFRSRDQGETWQLVFPAPGAVTGEARLGDESNHSFFTTDNWPGKTVHAILIDPHHPEHLFIVIKKEGARQPADDFYGRQKRGLLLYGSTDEGGTWKELAEWDSEEIHLLTFGPARPAESRRIFAFTEKGVFRLTAGGEMERLTLPASILGLRHASCGIHPVSGQLTFYLSAVESAGEGGYASTIWKSCDLGQSWERCLTGLQARIPGDLPVFSQVSACQQDARRVWLIAEKFPELDAAGQRVEHHGILVSSDEGASWEWAVKMDDDHDPLNRVGGWAERDYGPKWGDLKGEEQISPRGRFAWDVVASPVDPQVCYTMDFSTIFHTADGGAHWQQLVTHLYPDGSVSSRGIDVLGAYGVFFDPFDPAHLALALTDVGIFHSFDHGNTWQHALAGVPRSWINTCYWLVFDPQVQGRAWSAWSAMHDIPRIKCFRDEHFLKAEGGICKSEDGLQSWQPSASGLPAHALCTHLVLDPSSPPGQRTLYAAVFKGGVYKSMDDGRTWSLKNHGLDPRNPFAWRLLLAPNGTLYLVVVKNRLQGREQPGALYQSTDGAESWQPLALPEGADFPNDLTCDPTGRLYLACWPRLVEGENCHGGVYARQVGDAAWQTLFDPAVHAYTVTVDPQNPAHLYLSTFDAALHHSPDRGQTWQRLRGFNFQWGYRPVPDPHHPGMLFVTTFGSSVWYGPAAGVPEASEDILET